MEFGSNLRQPQTRTSTRGIQFYNADSLLYPSTLCVGGWDKMISLRINPAKERSARTATSVYDYEKTVITAITPFQALILHDIIMDKIIPSLQEKNPEKIKIGFPINGVHMVAISNGVDKGSNPYLAIYKNISQDLIPEQKIYYEFNIATIVNNYEECKSAETTYSQEMSELKYFAKLLKHYALVLGGAEYHSNMEYGKYNRERDNLRKAGSINWSELSSSNIEDPKVPTIDSLDNFA